MSLLALFSVVVVVVMMEMMEILMNSAELKIHFLDLV